MIELLIQSLLLALATLLVGLLPAWIGSAIWWWGLDHEIRSPWLRAWRSITWMPWFIYDEAMAWLARKRP